jgi:2-dehydro-3-deoxygalactonokinase
VLARVSTSDGIADTYENWKKSGLDEYRRVFFYLSVIDDKIKELEQRSTSSLNELPVIISGMASSSIGMMELPYANVPFSIHGSDLTTKKIPPSDDFRHPIVLVSGIKSSTDIMRGEETQVLGCDIRGTEERVFILPGTHSKHAVVEHQSIASIQTFMTGELLSLLSNKSILAHSVKEHDDVVESAFNEGVTKGLKSNFLQECFAVRANHLFGRKSTQENYDFLKGVLIGTELRDLSKEKRRFTIVGTESMNRDYTAALKLLEVNEIETMDSELAAIRGHYRILTMLPEKFSS